MNQQKQINVDLNSLQEVKCPACKRKIFDAAFMIKYLPGIVSPSGNPALIKIPVNVCRYCGSIDTDEILIKYNEHGGKKQSFKNEK